MPCWNTPEEQDLIGMVKQGKTLTELCQAFKRSPEAIQMKLRRLGLTVPPDKVTSATTTTLEPIKPAEDLISVEEAAKMALGCIQRLNEKSLTALDMKRIRLIISALKSYIILRTEYVEKVAQVERRIDELNRVVLAQLEDKVAKAQTDEERRLWQGQVKDFIEKTRAEEKPYTIWGRR
jgi:hypothetical protein